MPESLPAIPGVKVVRVLERVGFTVVRISGVKGTLRNILAIIGMDAEELRKLL